jgi:DNA (cytosine-5)-methyltransferase 1
MGHDGSHANGGGQVAVCFDTTQVTSKTNRSNPQEGDPCHPLASEAHAPAIAFRASGQEGFTPSEIAPPITSTDGGGAGVPTIAFQSSQSGVREVETHATLDSNNGSRRHNGILQQMAVRRLTPTECERLQGFPDNYTLVQHNGKSAADGPRYKALGNSMARPCLEWLGKRIKAQLESHGPA